MRGLSTADLRRIKDERGLSVHVVTANGAVDILEMPQLIDGEHDGSSVHTASSSTVIVSGLLSNCTTSKVSGSP